MTYEKCFKIMVTANALLKTILRITITEMQ
jgi:hypothetical protein